jgi:hypothetical protein
MDWDDMALAARAWRRTESGCRSLSLLGKDVDENVRNSVRIFSYEVVSI